MEDYTFDLYRILIGNVPLIFLAEIALRTTILYIYLLTLLRVSGKRSADKLTPVDVAIIVGLGSAAGDPMFYADIPVIYGMAVITVVIALRRIGIDASEKSDLIEHFVEGNPYLLIDQGVLNRKALSKADILRDELFARIRTKGHKQLGEVEKIYVEIDGDFSIYSFPEDKVKPGLPIEPPWEISPPVKTKAGEQAKEDALLACYHCGFTKEFKKGNVLDRCPSCENDKGWVKAVS